jgi:hypothetical protein
MAVDFAGGVPIIAVLVALVGAFLWGLLTAILMLVVFGLVQAVRAAVTIGVAAWRRVARPRGT